MQNKRSVHRIGKASKLVVILGLGLVLSACSAPTETFDCCAEEAGELLIEARGNEPFWNLKVFETRAEVNRLGEEPERFAWQYSASNEYQLFAPSTPDSVGVVQLNDEICRDSMTGMPYPKNAVMRLDTNAYYGCAGDPKDMLTVGEWHITRVKSSEIAANVSVTINFGENGEVYGNSGCNRFVGNYQITGEVFQLNQLAATRMACPSIQMDIETAVLDSLNDVTRFNVTDNGALHLVTHSGEYLRAILK